MFGVVTETDMIEPNGTSGCGSQGSRSGRVDDRWLHRHDLIDTLECCGCALTPRDRHPDGPQWHDDEHE